MSAKFEIVNGFPNHDGLGEMLAVRIVKGSIKVGDRLVLNDVKIPILEIRQIDFTTPIVMITIPRNLDASGSSDLKLFEFFGKTVPVEEN
jgi:hypothetical protein